MDDYPYATLGAGIWFRYDGCTALIFPPCSEMCCTVLATWGLPRTVVTRTISSGLDAARSMWTSWLTPLTRP
jgi:hypothetical protein